MTTNSGGYKCLCPACGSRMRIRAQCYNLACGATYSGSLTRRG